MLYSHHYYGVILCFLFQITTLNGQSDINYYSLPSCPDEEQGVLYLTPSQDLMDDFSPISDWTFEYINLSTGGYKDVGFIFRSLPIQIPTEITGLNPGLYEGVLFLDSKQECYLEFDFTVDIAQGCPCPQLIDQLHIEHSCVSGAGLTEVLVKEFDPDRQILIEWSDGQLTNIAQRPFYAGSYQVSVSDGYGCSEVQDFTIDVISGLSLSSLFSEIGNACGADGYINLTPNVGEPSDFYSNNMELNYLWSNGERTEDIYGLEAGNYCVTISLGNGTDCQEIHCYDVLSAQPDPACLDQTIVEVEQPSDINEDYGNITITPYGGSFPYSIVWDDGYEGVFNRLDLAPGTYCYTITDGTCCEKTGCSILESICELDFKYRIEHMCHEGSSNYVEIIDLLDRNGNSRISDVVSSTWTVNGVPQGDPNGIFWGISGRGKGTYCLEVTLNDGCEGSFCAELIDFSDWVRLEFVEAPLDCFIDAEDTDFENSIENCCVSGNQFHARIVVDPNAPYGINVLKADWYEIDNFNNTVYHRHEGLEYDGSNSFSPYTPHFVELDVDISDEGPGTHVGCQLELSFDFSPHEPLIKVSKVQPCIGFCDGKISIKVLNENQNQVNIYKKIESSSTETLIKSGNDMVIRSVENALCGAKTHRYRVEIGTDCYAHLEVYLGEKKYEREFVEYIDQGDWLFECVYDLKCGEEVVGREGDRARTKSTGSCRRNFFDDIRRNGCKETQYWCEEELIRTADFKPVKQRYYQAVASVAQIENMHFDNVDWHYQCVYDMQTVGATLSTCTTEDLNNMHPCRKMKYCASDPLTCFKFKGWITPRWNELVGTNLIEDQGNGCFKVKCGIVGIRNYTVCQDDPSYIPKGYRGNNQWDINISINLGQTGGGDPNFNGGFDNGDFERECNLRSVRAALLLERWNEIVQMYPLFSSTELGMWVKNREQDPRIWCTTIKFCCSNLRFHSSDIDNIDCSAGNEQSIEDENLNSWCWPIREGAPIPSLLKVACKKNNSDFGNEPFILRVERFSSLIGLFEGCSFSDFPLPPAVTNIDEKWVTKDLIDTDDEILFYGPNPTSGVLHVFSEKIDLRKLRFDIFDLQGNRILENGAFDGSGTLDLNRMEKNIYFLKIYGKEYNDILKIIKL